VKRSRPPIIFSAILERVSCDGSDIIVTVPGVNGVSASVEASATMTLRTGDVKADGVVNNTDLK
jgi:hypothetical protein